MTAVDVVLGLARERGIALWVDAASDRIRFRGPPGAMDAGLRALVDACRADLRRVLAAACSSCGVLRPIMLVDTDGVSVCSRCYRETS